jgi:predicted dehydrogenase
MAKVTRRRFLRRSVAAGLALALPGRSSLAAPFSRVVGANDDVRVAMIGLGELGGPGVGARGRQLIDRLRGVPNVRIAALCDVDERILARETQRLAAWRQTVKTYTDMRDAFDSPDIDAVFVATPNHWHALATVWACQAGKDVYVEKPASHSLWEGRQMVAAARKYKRIVQVGTQRRSSDASQQTAEFLRRGQLGKVLYAQAIIYRRRESIGKVAGPQTVPPSVDNNLWLGPAFQAPLMRSVFHYDWHWFWATGNGEIGNNGVHYLDQCRWFLGQNGLPRRAMSLGGRFAFDDDGQTANTQIALLDYEPAPIICEVRGLAEKPGSKKMDDFRSVTTGIIVQCEGGYCLISGEKGAAYDNDDKKIKEFTNRGDPKEHQGAHQTNFVEAVRSRNSGELNAEIIEGHYSAALCHMANVSYRLGRESKPEVITEATKADPQCSDAFERFNDHVAANGIDLAKTPAILGSWVTLDQNSQQFVGEFAEKANSLSRRTYREPFVVPEIA